MFDASCKLVRDVKNLALSMVNFGLNYDDISNETVTVLIISIMNLFQVSFNFQINNYCNVRI